MLFQYGLCPIYWDGDLFIIEDPNRDLMLVFSGGTADEFTTPALEAVLEYIAMYEETFWTFYATI